MKKLLWDFCIVNMFSPNINDSTFNKWLKLSMIHCTLYVGDVGLGLEYKSPRTSHLD